MHLRNYAVGCYTRLSAVRAPAGAASAVGMRAENKAFRG